MEQIQKRGTNWYREMTTRINEAREEMQRAHFRAKVTTIARMSCSEKEKTVLMTLACFGMIDFWKKLWLSPYESKIRQGRRMNNAYEGEELNLHNHTPHFEKGGIMNHRRDAEHYFDLRDKEPYTIIDRHYGIPSSAVKNFPEMFQPVKINTESEKQELKKLKEGLRDQERMNIFSTKWVTESLREIERE